MQGNGRSPLLLLLDPRNSHFPVFPSIHTTGQNRKDMGGVASCRKCNQQKKLRNRKNYLRKGREGQVRPLKNGAKVSCLSLSLSSIFSHPVGVTGQLLGSPCFAVVMAVGEGGRR